MTGSVPPSPPAAPPVLIFVSDELSLAEAKKLAMLENWPEGAVQQGNIAHAIAYLKDHPAPKYLVVELPSAGEAPVLLDQLADICDPDVKVIATGKINEFSFYSWLMNLGLYNYLLEPFPAKDLQAAMKKGNGDAPVATTPQKHESTVIAFMGTRGGVGTTTIATNVAYLLAKEYGKKTALLDLDAHFGSVAMACDVEPSRDLHLLFDSPERIDALFLDRVMVKFTENLGVLCTEEPLKDTMMSRAQSAELLLKHVREKYNYVVVDVPRVLTPLVRSTLAGADKIVLVSELSLLGLRDLVRLREFIRTLGKPEPMVIANREGLMSKHEIRKHDFEKHYGRLIDVHVPCLMEAFSATASGEMLIETSKKHTEGLKALHRITDLLLGIAPTDREAESKVVQFFGKIKKGTEHVRKKGD